MHACVPQTHIDTVPIDPIGQGPSLLKHHLLGVHHRMSVYAIAYFAYHKHGQVQYLKVSMHQTRYGSIGLDWQGNESVLLRKTLDETS